MKANIITRIKLRYWRTFQPDKYFFVMMMFDMTDHDDMNHVSKVTKYTTF